MTGKKHSAASRHHVLSDSSASEHEIDSPPFDPNRPVVILTSENAGKGFDRRQACFLDIMPLRNCDLEMSNIVEAFLNRNAPMFTYFLTTLDHYDWQGDNMYAEEYVACAIQFVRKVSVKFVRQLLEQLILDHTIVTRDNEKLAEYVVNEEIRVGLGPVTRSPSYPEIVITKPEISKSMRTIVCGVASRGYAKTLLHGVKLEKSWMPMPALIYHWARSPRFKGQDRESFPFEDKFFKSSEIRWHAQFKSDWQKAREFETALTKIEPIVVPKWYEGKLSPSQEEIIASFNEFITTGDFDKKIQCFYHGKPNTYKTSFIKYVILKQYKPWQIFRIKSNGSRFAFGGFEPGVHKIIYNDEVRLSNFDVEIIKLALCGEPFDVDMKYVTKGNLCLRDVPIIFVSNFPLEHPYHKLNEDNLAALRARMAQYKATAWTEHKPKLLSPHLFADFFTKTESHNLAPARDQRAPERRCAEKIVKRQKEHVYQNLIKII